MRSVGAHLPSSICEPSPADLFKLFFDEEIVQRICDASNEYAERNKTSRPAMYRYYKQMTIEDFYALVGIFIHLGYRKIPRYRLMWMANEHPGHSEETVTRNVKRDGVTEKKEVPIPVMIYNYNRFMNGVDRSDQLIKYYNVLRQTQKYWKTLFFHFIDIAIVNKEVHPRGKLSHFN